MMHAGGVTESFSRGARNRVGRFGRKRSRRVVVKIDTHREPFIVSKPLTRSSKRTRQPFPTHLYCKDFHPDIAFGGTAREPLPQESSIVNPSPAIVERTRRNHHVETRRSTPTGKPTTDACTDPFSTAEC